MPAQMTDQDPYKPGMDAFGRLCRIMDELRVKCPWDREQTMASLRNLTIEECYELVDAILVMDPAAIREELGDLLLHIVFYTRIAQEEGYFDMASLIHALCDKLVERHPHVYGDLSLEDADAVKQNWENIKRRTGKARRLVLSGVPKGLPALIKAYRMQEKTAQVGFEWEEPEQVWKKVEEELGELQGALAEQQGPDRVEEEFGDVLFALVNYARFIGVDPETALEKVNLKFKSRFEYIETQAGDQLEHLGLQRLDQLWEEAKRHERNNA